MKKYVLVWQDEFDKPGKPDPSKWSYDIGAKKWGNAELQYYTEGLNCDIKDSVLTITCKIEDYEGSPYTSTRLTTFEKKHFQYGRLAISAKIPTAKGSWPAIWMLPVDKKTARIPWPRCGEIDIMEHITHMMDTVHVSLHTELYNHMIKTQRTKFEKFPGITGGFHEFAFDWTKDYIEFFIDGVSFQKYEKNAKGYIGGEAGWPFDKPYYLILNQAIGGTWGGEVDVKDYPSPFKIDYVRYYDILEN
jgi:beta-glucanase (GH16 family)